MTNDKADDRYGSLNIAENDSSRSAGVKLSAVITLQTDRMEKVRRKTNVLLEPAPSTAGIGYVNTNILLAGVNCILIT